MDNKPMILPWPRLMKEPTAGAYIERSASWMRNMRYEDGERLARGEPAKGPKFIKQGASVRYPIEFLDAWVDQFIHGEVEGWQGRECNTSGLKYVGGGS